ncbi:MAG: hypothetical protein J5I90_19925 [Caldilineales bacterium]|nr:hypothetical protein [Caldilineales bacterium]
MNGTKPASLLIILVALLAAMTVSGCEPKLRGTSIAEMDRAEAAWEANPVLSYRIVVEVNRPDELRRNELTVENGVVTSAVMLLWDRGQREWREPFPLDETQAFPWTVPGLFDTVRGAIEHSGRTVIRVEMGGEPPFPRQIQFGPVWEDMQMVEGTESEIRVRAFEPF